MRFDPLPEIVVEEPLFESGLLLAGAVAPAVVRRHVPEHTVRRPVHYLVRMSRSTHVLLTSRFETLSLAVGVAMPRSIGFCRFEHGRENGKKFSRREDMAAGRGGFRGGDIRLPGLQRRWIRCS